MVVANDTLTAQVIGIPSDSPLVDFATDTEYQPKNHFVSVKVAPTGIIVLTNKKEQSAVQKDIGPDRRREHLGITVRNRDVSVSLPRIPDSRGELSIALVSGKMIHKTRLPADTGHFYIRGLPAGVYIVRYRRQSVVLSRSIAIY